MLFANIAAKLSKLLPVIDIKKLLFKALVILIAVILLFGIFSMLFSQSDEIEYSKHPIVYEKNGELYLMSHKNKDSYRLSGSQNGDVHLSEDGKLIFFCDNYSDGKFDLLYCKTDKNTSKSVELAKSVTGYQITDSGEKVLYIKDSTLYLSDLKKSYQIAENVTAYRFTKDNGKMLYISDGSLFIRGLGKKDSAERISTDVESILTRDRKLLYFKKDGALYFAGDGKGAIQVLDNIHTVFSPKEGVCFAVTRIKTENEAASFSVYKLDGSEYTECASGLSEAPDSRRVLVKSSTESTELMILKLDGTVIPVEKASDSISSITVSYDDKYVYCIDKPSADGAGSFVRYKLAKNGLRSPKKLAEDVSSFTIHGKKDELITTVGSEFGVYSNGKYRRISTGTVRIMYVDIENLTVYYIDKLTGESGTLNKVRKGRVTEIANEVSDFVFRGKNCYYIKNGGLYYKKGNKAQKLADSNVDSIQYKYIYIKEGVY